MKTTKQRGRIHLIVFVIGCILILAAGSIQRAQQRQRQAVDSNGAPLFKVDPFWPKPLPTKSAEKITGSTAAFEDRSSSSSMRKAMSRMRGEVPGIIRSGRRPCRQ